MRTKLLFLFFIALILAFTPANAATCSGTCLEGNRFGIQAPWTAADGSSGEAFISTNEEGTLIKSNSSVNLSFFDRQNWELLVKVINGCGLNGHYWVFYAGTTNVGFSLKVHDYSTDAENTYKSIGGPTASPVLDTQAFRCAGPHFQMEARPAITTTAKLPSVLMSFTGISNGVFSWFPSGNVSYTPNANFSGISNGWFKRQRWMGPVEVEESRRLSIVVIP